MSSELTPKVEVFTNRELPPDSPLNEVRDLWEFVEMHGDGFSLENWRIVEAALDRVARIVVEADKWAHAYEACSSDPGELRLWRVVRGVQEGVTLDPGREHPSPHAHISIDYIRSLCADPSAFRSSSPVPWKAHRLALCDEVEQAEGEIARLNHENGALENELRDVQRAHSCEHAVEYGSIVCLKCGLDTVPGQSKVYLPPVPGDEWGNFA